MNVFQSVAVSVLSLVLLCDLVQGWNQTHRDHILEVHNEMRRRPNACEMNKLEYDIDLENQAKRWAHNCVFDHELVKGRGENLAFNTARQTEVELINTAMDSWYNEINYYSYGQRSCGMACHYTQLVWGTTTKVGCYTYRCPYLHGGARNSWYLVCFYTPMGNWNGQKPYKRQCPARCLAGQIEDNGLCVGKPTPAPVECKDDNASCAAWASRNQCARNAAYMLKKCKKSCGVCKSENEDEVVHVCEDTNPRCDEWAKWGECRANPGYMLKNCKKSCRQC